MSNTVYPGAIDSFYNPTTSDTLATMVHHTLHGGANDAVAAIETKLGTGSTSQTPSTGMYLVGTGSGATKWVSTLTSPSITTSLLDANNNTWIGQTPTASAVNYVNVTNAATGNAPSSGSAGSDTNVDYNLTSKGSGKVRENGSSLLDFRTSFSNFIQSGCIWTAGSGLTASMTAGTIWINGIEYTVSSISSHTFSASNDTYVDYTAGTGVVYTSVSNNAASPSLASNSVRIGIIVAGSSTISSINQGQTNVTAPVASSVIYAVSDSLGNLIYPAVPNQSVLGYRYITSNFSGITSTSGQQVTGLSVTINNLRANQTVKIVAGCNGTSNTTSTASVALGIWRGTVGSGTQVNNASLIQPNAITVAAFDTPPAGSVTYNVAGFVSAGSGTVGASSVAPAYITVEV